MRALNTVIAAILAVGALGLSTPVEGIDGAPPSTDTVDERRSTALDLQHNPNLVDGCVSTVMFPPDEEMGLTFGLCYLDHEKWIGTFDAKHAPWWHTGDLQCVGDGRSGPRVQLLIASQGRTPSYTEVEHAAALIDATIDMSAIVQGSRRTVRWKALDCHSSRPKLDVGVINLPENWHRLTSEQSLNEVKAAVNVAGLNDLSGNTIHIVLIGFGERVDWEHDHCGLANVGGHVEYPGSTAYVVEPCLNNTAVAHELLHLLGADHVVGWGEANDLMGNRCAPEDYCREVGAACPSPIWAHLADCGADSYFNVASGNWIEPPGPHILGSPNTAASPWLHTPPGKPAGPALFIGESTLRADELGGKLAVYLDIDAYAIGTDGQALPVEFAVTGPSSFESEWWSQAAFGRVNFDTAPGIYTIRVGATQRGRRVEHSWRVVLKAPGGTSLGRFKDVPSDHTFFDDIERFADAGITRGCNPPTNDRFCPESPVTRGQMAAFLTRALRLSGGESRFADTQGHLFTADIAALADAGVTRGCNPPRNDRFCPDEAVTRGQMAAFLVRALELRGGDTTFLDTTGHIFEKDIASLAEAKITKGCNPPDNTRFCPDEAVTRGQMAAFLVRAGLAASKIPGD